MCCRVLLQHFAAFDHDSPQEFAEQNLMSQDEAEQRSKALKRKSEDPFLPVKLSVFISSRDSPYR